MLIDRRILWRTIWPRNTYWIVEDMVSRQVSFNPAIGSCCISIQCAESRSLHWDEPWYGQGRLSLKYPKVQGWPTDFCDASAILNALCQGIVVPRIWSRRCQNWIMAVHPATAWPTHGWKQLAPTDMKLLWYENHFQVYKSDTDEDLYKLSH